MMATVKAEHVELSSELLVEEAELPSDESGDQEESSGESSGGESDREQNGAEDGGSDDGSGGDEGAAEDGKAGDAADESNPNAGWADAMAKILGKKTPQNQPGILVKNKQLEKIKAKEKKERLEARNKLDKKRAWEMMGRVKPNVVADRDMEKTLQRTATRGVVQLFNAVKKHQKTVDEKVKEVGGSERKKAKILSAVSKRDFIDVLRGTDMVAARVPVKTEKVTGPDEEDVKPSWGVLREDFMMGATMRDWDKASDTEDAPAEGSLAEGSRAAFKDSDSDD